jgi:hypothetical protein
MENFAPDSKFSYLEKGYKPIQVCIGNIDNDLSAFFDKNIEKFRTLENVDNVDYNSGDISFYDQNKMLNGGPGTYVISDVNSKDKCTTGLFDCTSLIVVGEEKETEKTYQYFHIRIQRRYSNQK